MEIKNIKILGYLLLLSILACGFYACTSKQEKTVEIKNVDSIATIQFAKGFTIKYVDGCKVVELYSPRNNELLQKYILYTHDIPASLSDSKIAIYIKIPVKTVTCLSTTHIAFLDKLHLIDCITGIASKDQVNNNDVRKKTENGQIIEIGEADQIQFEKLAQLHPEIIFSYEIPGSATTGSLLINKLEIPQVTVSEFLESHPLGQLEWIKFMAAFFDKEQMAFQIFDSIAAEYNFLLQLSAKAEPKPDIITSLPWKGQWHLSSGNSLMNKYIQDAGGNYVMNNIAAEGNLVLPVEAVYEKALQAQYWINVGVANSRQDIINTDERLSTIEAFKNGNIYNNTAISNINGWSDYYESGVVNPHIVLKDLIKILHPELLPDYELYYYKKLE